MANNIIYILQDPISFEVRYVGLSTQGVVRSKQSHKGHCKSWIQSLKKIGLKPIVRVLQQWDCISIEELNKAEIYWISYFQGNGSPLTNLTTGGEGQGSRPVSEETRRKISEKLKGRKLPAEHCKRMSIALKGRAVSQEHRDKLSAASKGKSKSPEHVSKIVEAKTGSKWGHHSEESKNKIANSLRGKKRGPTSALQKQRSSEAAKKRWDKYRKDKDEI